MKSTVAGALVTTLLLLFSGLAAIAQSAPVSPPLAPTLTTEQKLNQLVDLLSQDDVRALLQTKIPDAKSALPLASQTGDFADLDQWASKRRSHLARIFGSWPSLPGEISAAMQRLAVEISAYGSAAFLFDLCLSVLAGLAGAYLTYRCVVWRNLQIGQHNLLSYIWHVIGERFLPLMGYGFAALAMFFIAQWTPMLSAVLLPWIMLSFLLPLWFVFCQLLRRVFAEAEQVTLAYWVKGGKFLVTLVAVSWALLRTLGNLGVERPVLLLLSYFFAMILLAVAIYCVWRRPNGNVHSERTRSIDVLLIFLLFALMGLWIAGPEILFWLGFFALVLPGMMKMSTVFMGRLLAAGMLGSEMAGVLLGRALRLSILSGAVLWLLYLVRVHPHALPGSEVVNAIFVGLLHGLLVLLIADFAWAAINVAITRRLQHSVPGGHGVPGPDDRLRTVLPILRNVIGILIGAVALMTTLSELGVNIAPLMASAGILGIALGFGSQTLVKDIISGVFYMIDDAFRVGEYIQSGNYKGTVESFSIRSVKLRHHRGPIYTVPFGSLGAVENMSRDWSVDKFLITVDFDTDLAKVKKLSKEIGAQLKEDPELGPSIIETVKLKGVEKFSDYGIALSFGMMVKPDGQQSMIRRRAYAMIKDAFEQNDIYFASLQGSSQGKPRSRGEEEAADEGIMPAATIARE